MLTSNCSFPSDIQEPFRWIADVVVMDVFESGVLDLPDFYFTGDDYRHRFEPEAKQRFLDLIREQFNSGVSYKGRVSKRDTVVEQKTAELGRYLVGRSEKLDLFEPSPRLTKTDSRGLRIRILSLPQPMARRLRIGKSTPHYLRRNALGERSFNTYSKVRKRMASYSRSATTGEGRISRA